MPLKNYFDWDWSMPNGLIYWTQIPKLALDAIDNYAERHEEFIALWESSSHSLRYETYLQRIYLRGNWIHELAPVPPDINEEVAAANADVEGSRDALDVAEAALSSARLARYAAYAAYIAVKLTPASIAAFEVYLAAKSAETLAGVVANTAREIHEENKSWLDHWYAIIAENAELNDTLSTAEEIDPFDGCVIEDRRDEMILRIRLACTPGDDTLDLPAEERVENMHFSDDPYERCALWMLLRIAESNLILRINRTLKLCFNQINHRNLP